MASNAPDQALRAVVRGMVHGVGFRYFVQRRALSLGLRGTVRNRDDGSVEVYAEGPRGALERLLDALREGPPSASVERVEQERAAATGTVSGFRIVR